jgi:hypothetical protein
MEEHAMATWKPLLSRLALSTVALTLFTGLGLCLGVMLGAIVEMAGQALLNVPLPVEIVVPTFAGVGITVSLVWWATVIAQAQTAPAAGK